MRQVPCYEVLSFTCESFFTALSSDICCPGETSANNVAQYIWRYLEQLEAKTVIVEYTYTDGDFLEDHASYYVRCFNDYRRHCKRLHFFRDSFDEAHFSRLILRDSTDDELEALVKGYLGFIVVRPLPKAVIGRTVLASYPSDNGRRNYTSLRVYRANLFGLDLSIESLAFQEQDTVLAACATVALWSAFHKASDLFGTFSPRPAEITKVANGAGSTSRAIPSHGLTPLQMAHAVRSVGLEPEVIAANPAVPLVSVIYSHLKLGLPVVLGVDIESQGLHALTIAGYSMITSQAIGSEVGHGYSSPPFSGLRINEFYAHDDQIGPFSRLRVIPSSSSECPVYFTGSWKDPSGKELVMTPQFLLIPVYNKIRVTFVDMQGWIQRLWEVLTCVIVDHANYEWDTYLVASNGLKTEFAMELKGHPAQQSFLTRHHPRFIWRNSLRYNGKVVLDLFADATDMQHSMPFYDVLWYNSGLQSLVAQLVTAPQLSIQLNQMLTIRFLEFLRSTSQGASIPA
jgi:hypothetical protein